MKFLNKIQNLKISSSINSLKKTKLSRKSKTLNSTEDLNREKEKKIKIHQLVPVLAPRDAVGNEVLAIRAALRNQGYASDIYVEKVHPEMMHESKSYFSYKDRPKADVWIYHFATGSKLVNAILEINQKLIIIFHNITPEKYFLGINDDVVQALRLARKQLKTLKNHASLTIAHSQFSLYELQQIGFSNVVTLPVLIDFSSYDVEFNEELLEKFKNSVNILFVGRLAPHKKIEKLLKGGSNMASCQVIAEVCLHCGERFYSQETIERFEKIELKLAENETQEFHPLGSAFQIAS